MGQSTDAILMYGVNLGEGEGLEWPSMLTEEGESYPDIDGYIASLAGLKEPAGEDYQDPAWSAFWAAKRKSVEAFPVNLVSHCSGDYPMWVLAVRNTVQRARRGYPETPTMREIAEADRDALKAFCDATGLPWSEPGWVLCSDWN